MEGAVTMQMNRLVIFLFNVLVVLAFVTRIILTGPVLFNHAWLFWSLLFCFAIGIIYLSYSTFFHPTPLEIVSYHINLIMRHTSEDEDEAYDYRNKLYLTEEFSQSENYDFFYYGDCCAKLDEYAHMKIKLAINHEDFNDLTMIIKTMDDQYIKFHLTKETSSVATAFLYDWLIDKIEYSDYFEFMELVEDNE